MTPSHLLLIDRMTSPRTPDETSRLTDSAETAFFEGHNRAWLVIWDDNGVTRKEYSTAFEADGIVFTEPTDQMFNFNNPFGACPRCEDSDAQSESTSALLFPTQRSRSSRMP